jgi:hypothetical protein
MLQLPSKNVQKILKCYTLCKICWAYTTIMKISLTNVFINFNRNITYLCDLYNLYVLLTSNL